MQNGGWGLDSEWSDTKCVTEKGPGRKHRMLDFFLKHTKPRQVSQWSATVKGMTEVCDDYAQVYEDREQSLKVSGVAELGQAFSIPSKTQNAQRLANARRSSDASRDERAAKRKCLVADALVQKLVPKKDAQQDKKAAGEGQNGKAAEAEP